MRTALGGVTHGAMSRSPMVVQLLTGILSLALAAPVAAGGAETTAGERFVLRFAAVAEPLERTATLSRHGLRAVDRLEGSDFVLVEADDAGVARGAQSDAAVADIRPPLALRAFAEPNDPLYRLQWHLPMIQAPAAWDVTAGDGAVVAVLDTGVDRSLSDLAGTRFTSGMDFVNGDTTPEDDNGHGSHVIGTIAQTSNNALGVAGVAYRATVMPVKVLDGAGAGDDWQVAQGLHWAADHGADVVNLSLGAPSGSPLLQEAVNYASSRGVTVVAAAGNAGVDRIAFPAAYAAVIAVGAVRLDRQLAPYSNRGPELELVAPGGDATVDQNGDGYGDGVLQQTVRPGASEPVCFCFLQGTSMAAPHVSGVAALLVAAGTDDPARVRAALTSSALDLGPTGRDERFGFGLVQARRALDAAARLPEPSPQPPPATEEPPDTTLPDEPAQETVPGQARSIEAACPSGEVPEDGFGDVPHDSGHEPAIDCLVWHGIVSGVARDRYAPAAAVTREQMASFLARAIEAAGSRLPASPPDAFDDDATSIHQRRIDQLAAAGVVSGTARRTFSPRQPVSRAQMATFLLRAIEHVTQRQVNPRLDSFDDDDGSIHEARIDAVATIGVAAGTGFRRFDPASPVRRDQMASFVARALDYLAEHGHPVAR